MSLSFYESEVQRVWRDVGDYCHSIYDRHVAEQVPATISDWSYSIAQSAIAFVFHFEDPTMEKTIGLKVNRLVDGDVNNFGTGECRVEYGLIVNNIFAYILNEDPFEGLREITPEQRARMEHLAGMALVRWFLKDGTFSFLSWHKLADLSMYGESNVQN